MEKIAELLRTNINGKDLFGLESDLNRFSDNLFKKKSKKNIQNSKKHLG